METNIHFSTKKSKFEILDYKISDFKKSKINWVIFEEWIKTKNGQTPIEIESIEKNRIIINLTIKEIKESCLIIPTFNVKLWKFEESNFLSNLFKEYKFEIEECNNYENLIFIKLMSNQILIGKNKINDIPFVEEKISNNDFNNLII